MDFFEQDNLNEEELTKRIREHAASTRYLSDFIEGPKNDLFLTQCYLTWDEMGVLLEQAIERNVPIPDLIHELISKSAPMVE